MSMYGPCAHGKYDGCDTCDIVQAVHASSASRNVDECCQIHNNYECDECAQADERQQLVRMSFFALLARGTARSLQAVYDEAVATTAWLKKIEKKNYDVRVQHMKNTCKHPRTGVWHTSETNDWHCNRCEKRGTLEELTTPPSP